MPIITKRNKPTLQEKDNYLSNARLKYKLVTSYCGAHHHDTIQKVEAIRPAPARTWRALSAKRHPPRLPCLHCFITPGIKKYDIRPPKGDAQKKDSGQ
jgi:hypothetical protein